MSRLGRTRKLLLIDAFYGAHVRVAVLTNIYLLRCDICARTNRVRVLHAAYEVLGVRVCRKHLAKLIDATGKTLVTGKASVATRRRASKCAVTSLTQVRKNQGRTIERDFRRALEKIGVLEIPDPDIE